LPPGWGLDARLTTLLCKTIIVAKCKEEETGWSISQEWTNLAESFKEGYSSKKSVLSIMMMMKGKVVLALN
jgi:hypothetical protein